MIDKSCVNLYFLRHLQTQNNVAGIINGRNMGLPVLAFQNIIGTKDMDIIYCSTALRCRQTIKCFIKTNHASAIVHSDLLLERDMGRLEGMKRRDAIAEYPNLFTEGRFHVTDTPPDGESFIAFQKRAQTFCQNFIKKTKGNILVCSHNQFLKMLYFSFFQIPVTEESWKVKTFPFGQVVSITL